MDYTAEIKDPPLHSLRQLALHVSGFTNAENILLTCLPTNNSFLQTKQFSIFKYMKP